MNRVIRKRGGGKTTKLIKLSAKTGDHIVCADASIAYHLRMQARAMKLEIPLPLTYREFITGRCKRLGIRSVLIDNAEYLIDYIARFNGVNINAVSFSISDV